MCAFVRHTDHPQLVTIQYSNGEHRSYTSTDRDSLIASFLDGVRGSGNRDVHVRMSMLQVRKIKLKEKDIIFLIDSKKVNIIYYLQVVSILDSYVIDCLKNKKEPEPILHSK